MKYFIIDAGEKMSDMAKLVMDKLDKEKAHYLMFITDEEYYIGVEEVNEDHFLDVVNQMKAQLN
jgi:hypothetical protein